MERFKLMDVIMKYKEKKVIGARYRIMNIIRDLEMSLKVRKVIKLLGVTIYRVWVHQNFGESSQ